MRWWTWGLLGAAVVLIWLLTQLAEARLLLLALVLEALGLALYSAILDRPGPYGGVVGATMLILAGVVLLISVGFVGARLELLLILWPLVFPIGLGFGWWTWRSLDRAGADAASVPDGADAASLAGGASRTVLVCIRAGLALLWALTAWTCLVLNIPRTTGRDLQVQNTLVVLLGILTALCIRAAGNRHASVALADYSIWLHRRQVKSRQRVAGKFAAVAAAHRDKYRDLRESTETRRRTNDDVNSLPAEELPPLPELHDDELARAVADVRYAERAAADAARAPQWNRDALQRALEGLEGSVERLERLVHEQCRPEDGPLGKAATALGGELRSRLGHLKVQAARTVGSEHSAQRAERAHSGE